MRRAGFDTALPWTLIMNMLKNLSILVLVGCAVAAHADTRLIEGRGAAKNAEGLTSRFAVRVGQKDRDPAQGRLEIGWQRGDVKIAIVCEHPNMVAVREREGRMQGEARVTVQKGNDKRTWEGTVYLTAWDTSANNHRDRIRVRFIRNHWEAPEGDFFFDGLLSDGDLVVKRS